MRNIFYRISVALALMLLPVVSEAAITADDHEGQSQVSVIHAGRILTVPGKAAAEEMTIVIKNGRIDSVHDGYMAPGDFGENVRFIDLKDHFVMPGLVDTHVHLQAELGAGRDSETVNLSDEDVGMRSVMFAKRVLDAGFTTVRDVGAQNNQQLFALRKASEQGWMLLPRIVAGAGIGPTGAHNDVDGMRHELLDLFTSRLICDGPYDCRRAVREAIKFGADWIKITATGGVLSDTTTGTGQQVADDELREIMDTAHALGKKVAAHAHEASGINAALRAGVDSIEHGSYANADSHKLFKEQNSYLVPTLLAGKTVVDMAKNSDILPPAVAAKAIRVGEEMMQNAEASFRSGIKVAFGTDSGVSRHGINAEEAVLMREAGMSEADILVSATITAAEMLGLLGQIDTIEAGKDADIIATKGNPLEDIKALLDVGFVMKSGRVAKD